jgi:ABC-2 type transport system ATP-binding protein
VTHASSSAFGAPIIEAIGLVKRYGDLTAVNNIDLTVFEGEIFGILGPNGAGKTTTLEMIEGMRKPDSGSITVAGIDVVAHPRQLRKVIGAQLQTTALFDYLNAAELIKLYCALYDVDDSPARIDHLLGLVDLQEKRGAKVNELSGGQKQRLAITLALVNQPRVVFLDEPTTGLDPAARRALWSVVQGVRERGTTVVLTTHYMEEAEVLCDRIALVDRGRMIACDTTQALVRSLGMNATIKATIEEGSLSQSDLDAVASVTGASIESGRGRPELTLTTTSAQQSMIGLLELARQHQVTLGDLRSNQANLEDVFLSLTGRSYATESDANAAQPAPERGRSRRGRAA